MLRTRLDLKHILRLLICLASGLALTTAVGCGAGTATTTPTLTTTAGGTSFEDAIPMGSIGGERDYFYRTTCGSGGHYRIVHVAVAERDGKHYDIIDAECTLGPERRQFYFDVSGCFPCPD